MTRRPPASPSVPRVLKASGAVTMTGEVRVHVTFEMPKAYAETFLDDLAQFLDRYADDLQPPR